VARRVASFTPESVVAEGTGIHWKSPNPALEQAGLRAGGQGPAVKTGARARDRSGRCTVAGAFGTQRLVARGLRAAGEEHRLHKVLTDGGIRLRVVLSDIHGKAGRTMIKVLAAGESAQALFASRGSPTQGERRPDPGHAPPHPAVL